MGTRGIPGNCDQCGIPFAEAEPQGKVYIGCGPIDVLINDKVPEWVAATIQQAPAGDGDVVPGRIELCFPCAGEHVTISPAMLARLRSNAPEEK